MNSKTNSTEIEGTLDSILLMAEKDFSYQEDMAKAKAIAEKKSSIIFKLCMAAFLGGLSLLMEYGIGSMLGDLPATLTAEIVRGAWLLGAIYLPRFYCVLLFISAAKTLLQEPRISDSDLGRLQIVDRKSVADLIERIGSNTIAPKYKDRIAASLKQTLDKQNSNLYVYQSVFYTSATIVATETTEEEQIESAISSFIAPQAS